MDAHPDLPVLLLGRENNCGLPQARNHGIARARADKVMIIDADNLVYPNCLRRLADALDADPGASFAYATLEAFGDEPGLRSHLPWYVPWLCAANYLDAQAMIRRDVLERHGGYRETTSGSTAGRTGTCGCASPTPASTACTSPRCSAATARSARR